MFQRRTAWFRHSSDSGRARRAWHTRLESLTLPRSHYGTFARSQHPTAALMRPLPTPSVASFPRSSADGLSEGLQCLGLVSEAGGCRTPRPGVCGPARLDLSWHHQASPHWPRRHGTSSHQTFPTVAGFGVPCHATRPRICTSQPHRHYMRCPASPLTLPQSRSTWESPCQALSSTISASHLRC